MTPLLPATTAVLRAVRPCAPLFSNAILSELFTAEHTRGELTVLPTTEGGFYVVFDRTAANGQGVRARCATIEQAHAALERLAKTTEVRSTSASVLSPAEASAGPALPSGTRTVKRGKRG
jgi:hypothetical protein